MPRLIAFAICFFWMAAHMLAALAALGLAPVGYLVPAPFAHAGVVGGLALAAAHGAVAAGFLLAFCAVMLDEGAGAHETGPAVNAAFGGAILLAAATLFFLPVTALGGSAPDLFVQMAALAATYAAIHAEIAGSEPARVPTPAHVAQRMAVGAAHNSMLDALSGRAGNGEERL